MKTIKFNFGGKAWEVEANNSGWIAPGAPKELVELLKKAPRSGFTSKGVPIVKSDDDTNIYLGAAELRNEGESIHQAGGSGSSSSSSSGTTKQASTVPLAIAKEALGLKGLSKEAKAFFEGIVQEAVQEQKAKLDKALKSLLDIRMSEEQAKKILGISEEVAKKTLGL